MKLVEFVRRCEQVDGWHLTDKGAIRDETNRCPLVAVFGPTYFTTPDGSGLDARRIMAAADGRTDGEYREALLGLLS